MGYSGGSGNCGSHVRRRTDAVHELVKGVICGVRIEEIEEPTMGEICYLDKLVDELARGKTMEKIPRKC